MALDHDALLKFEETMICEPVRVRARADMSPRDKLCATGWTIEPSGCWVWRGQRDPNGRGRVSVRQRRYYAYRLMWEVASGAPVPDGLSVCHHCDNPSCLRPSHLFLGDQALNMADAASKRRMTGAPKLTNAQVEAIRAIWAGGGVTQRTIAQIYGVDHVTVNRIIRGRARTQPNRAA